MPKKKALDTAKLIEMVKAETPSAEIMKKMGFKTSTQLKAAYMSALIAEGKVPAIKGGRGALEKPPRSKPSALENVAASSSRKNWLKASELEPDDKFTLRKTKLGIALKKAE